VGLGPVTRPDLLVAIDVTMLGLDTRSDLLTFGEVNALVKSDDIDLFAIADQLITSKINHIDQTFRMQHTDGHWIWLRVRCELSQGAADAGLHLIGIAVDITEQKSLAEKTVEADLRLRDAIETIPEAFVLWDAGDRLVLCNSHFQRLHKLPDSAVTPGTSYETVIEVGSMPEVRTRLHEAGALAPGARTFEAQLDDGSWLHISERRTKDGGYVSVGTDITRIKEHEQKLVDNDLRLRATVIDLKRSQTALERQALELADLAEKYSERKTAPRKPTRTKSQVSRQYESRAAHAAQCHHRIFRDHGKRDVRHARLGKIPGILSRHPHQRSLPARSDQRHPGYVEDRSRPHEARLGTARSGRRRWRNRCAWLSGRANDKNLVLDADIERVIPVVADRRATKQIIVNLLSNAVKFTPDGGKVVVRSRLLKDSIVLMIADTGIGIARIRCGASADRSNRSKVSSPRPITALGLDWPSRDR